MGVLPALRLFSCSTSLSHLSLKHVVPGTTAGGAAEPMLIAEAACTAEYNNTHHCVAMLCVRRVFGTPPLQTTHRYRTVIPLRDRGKHSL